MEEYESADDSLSEFASLHGIKNTFMGRTSSVDPDTKSLNPVSTCTNLTYPTGWLQL